MKKRIRRKTELHPFETRYLVEGVTGNFSNYSAAMDAAEMRACEILSEGFHMEYQPDYREILEMAETLIKKV